MVMICICQKSWGRIWYAMMRNHQDTPPTLNGNDMYLSKVMGRNLACNDEEPSGFRIPPKP